MIVDAGLKVDVVVAWTDDAAVLAATLMIVLYEKYGMDVEYSFFGGKEGRLVMPEDRVFIVDGGEGEDG